jgi:hypothetical protein
MVKQILILIIVILSALNTLTIDPWVCGTSGKVCLKTQTCCQGPTSKTDPTKIWRCFLVSSGVCCSDGYAACPTGCICTKDDKCAPKDLITWLPDHDASTMSTSPVYNDELITAFIEGLQIFNNLPTAACDFKDLDSIKAGVIDILLDLEKDVWGNSSTALETLLGLYDIGLGIDKECLAVEGECKELALGISEVLAKVNNYLSDGQYVYTYYDNFENAKDKIARIAKLAADMLTAGDYANAGRTYGELVEMVFLFNYQA